MQNTHDIAIAKGAEVFELTYASAASGSSMTYDQSNWGDYIAEDASVFDAVRPEFNEEGVSLPAKWTQSVGLHHIPDNTGVFVHCEGAGFTLEHSLDGTTFVSLANGSYVDTSADAVILIRVIFPGGIENDPASLTKMTVLAISDHVLKSYSGVRDAVFEDVDLAPVRGDQDDPAIYSGAHIRLGGKIVIMPDTSAEPTTIKTVEFWAKKNADSDMVFLEILISGVENRLRVNAGDLVNFNAGLTVRLDGVLLAPSTTTVNPGEWHHYSVDFSVDSNDEIWIGNHASGTTPADMNLFGLAIYSSSPTGSYAANVAVPTLSVNDASSISVSSADPEVQIYAYAWTASAS
jgi:hypothetical protein